MMKTAEKRQKMAPELMKSNLLLGSGLLISIILNAGLTWPRYNSHDYFATDSGRLVRLAPLPNQHGARTMPSPLAARL
jgi:intracellular multiplication protein IcmL